MRNVLIFGVLGVVCLQLLRSPARAGPSGDVTIRLNNGADVVYVGEINKFELWITNDIPLGGMSIAFSTDWQLSYSWVRPYGNIAAVPPAAPIPVLQQYGDAVGAFDWGFSFQDRSDNLTPDSIQIIAVALDHALPAHAVSTKLYDLAFFAAPYQPAAAAGLCVDNILMHSLGRWEFSNAIGTLSFVPTFQGQLNSSATNPDAPPACFDVVVRPYVRGDANSDGTVTLPDATFIIQYIFTSGPLPVPLMAGDADCDGGVDISDVVYLVAYILGGGPAPCRSE